MSEIILDRYERSGDDSGIVPKAETRDGSNKGQEYDKYRELFYQLHCRPTGFFDLRAPDALQTSMSHLPKPRRQV